MANKWYGGLVNRMQEGCQYGEIKVGTGVTRNDYSDRYPFEVVKVIDQKHIFIRSCLAKRVDHNGLSENQQYEYTLVPYEQCIMTQQYYDDIRNPMTQDYVYFSHLGKRQQNKILKMKLGDVVDDNNIELKWNEKKGWGRYTIGVKEMYYDPTF